MGKAEILQLVLRQAGSRDAQHESQKASGEAVWTRGMGGGVGCS